MKHTRNISNYRQCFTVLHYRQWLSDKTPLCCSTWIDQSSILFGYCGWWLSIEWPHCPLIVLSTCCNTEMVMALAGNAPLPHFPHLRIIAHSVRPHPFVCTYSGLQKPLPLAMDKFYSTLTPSSSLPVPMIMMGLLHLGRMANRVAGRTGANKFTWPDMRRCPHKIHWP